MLAQPVPRSKTCLGGRSAQIVFSGWTMATFAGDDTDSHIDTLARLCNETTICYVACEDPSDEHFAELNAMKAQLEGMTQRNGNPYTLVPLPMASACALVRTATRLPATYANFLIINDTVLLPVYGLPEDDEAIRVMHSLFPDRAIGL